MWRKRKMRTWIGVVAAYAIALQALLTSVVATQMAIASPSDPAVMCWNSSDNTAPKHQPDGTTHATHQACIICSFASAAGLPPLPATLALEQIGETDVSWHALNAPIHLARQRSPQIPQGPPQSV